MWQIRIKMRRNQVERMIREIKQNKYKMGTRKADDDHEQIGKIKEQRQVSELKRRSEKTGAEDRKELILLVIFFKTLLTELYRTLSQYLMIQSHFQ